MSIYISLVNDMEAIDFLKLLVFTRCNKQGRFTILLGQICSIGCWGPWLLNKQRWFDTNFKIQVLPSKAKASRIKLE